MIPKLFIAVGFISLISAPAFPAHATGGLKLKPGDVHADLNKTPWAKFEARCAAGKQVRLPLHLRLPNWLFKLGVGRAANAYWNKSDSGGHSVALWNFQARFGTLAQMWEPGRTKQEVDAMNAWFAGRDSYLANKVKIHR